MTEKAQRELYLAIRKAKDDSKDEYGNVQHNIFLVYLYNHLNSLLTAPQFNLEQLFNECF